jgi:hypothetical protein
MKKRNMKNSYKTAIMKTAISRRSEPQHISAILPETDAVRVLEFYRKTGKCGIPAPDFERREIDGYVFFVRKMDLINS